MRIIPLAHQALRQLTLIGLLLSPFMLAPCYAAELVGKPTTVGGGGHTASVANVATSVASTAASMSSAVQSSVQAASAASQKVVEAAPVVPAAPPEPIPPIAPDEHHDDFHSAMEDMRANFHEDMGSFDDFGMSPELIIPIVAMILLFGGPVLLVIILAFLHYRAKARRQHNINANIDKLLAAGRDIPVELLLGEEATAVKRNVAGEVTTVYHGADSNMQKGFRNIGLGTGWLVFLTIAFGIKIGAFGFIFIGLGLSQVLIWKLSSPSASPNSIPNTDAARIQE